MKFKKRITMLAIPLILISSVFLTACGPSVPPNSSNVGSGGTSTPGGNSDGGGTSIPETPGTDVKLEDMFSKFKVIYGDENVLVKDPTQTGSPQVPFYTLVDRQISVLAEDLLFRLTAVYGAGVGVNTGTYLYNIANTAYGLKINEDTYEAGISTRQLVDRNYGDIPSPTYKTSDGNYITEITMYNIDEIGSFALKLSSGAWVLMQSPVVDRFKLFNTTHAIGGGFVWNQGSPNFNTSQLAQADEGNSYEDLTWNWGYDFVYVEDASIFDSGERYIITSTASYVGANKGEYVLQGGNLVWVGYNLGDHTYFDATYEQNGNGHYVKSFSFDVKENEFDFKNLNARVNANAFTNYSYYKAYVEHLKKAIANILNGTSNTSYSNAVKAIDHLGFTKNDRENITNYLLNVVIGSTAVNKDNEIKNSLLDFIQTNNNGTTVINESVYTVILENENENALIDSFHYYKAYGLLVPAMVERALSNAFGGVEVDRIKYDSGGNAIVENGKVVKRSVDDLASVEILDTTYFSLYPKMTRSENYDLAIDSVEHEEGSYPEVQTTGLRNIQRIILQPKSTKDGVAVVGLMLFVGTEENVSVSFKIKITYVANGVKFLDNYSVSSFTNPNKNDKSIFKITGPYDTADIFTGENIPWNFDLDISDGIRMSGGKYVSTDGTTKLDKYPTMGAYNGVEPGSYDLWNNNPYGLGGFEAGTNYVEVVFEPISATKMVNGVEVNINLSDVLFNVGFSDPLF